MGWGGGKFPVISQLNVLTAPGRIQDTQQFFIGKYGLQGENYHLGDLCFDWEPAIVPAPPWAEDEDNPRKDADARDWKRHCRNDLNGPNTGSGAKGTVYEDLTRWIKDGILQGQHIKYRYKRITTGTWRADREVRPTHLRITVHGPGW